MSQAVVVSFDFRFELRYRSAERFVFTPNPAGGYLFKGEGDLGLLLQMASPTGSALLGLTAKPPKIRWILPLAA